MRPLRLLLPALRRAFLCGSFIQEDPRLDLSRTRLPLGVVFVVGGFWLFFVFLFFLCLFGFLGLFPRCSKAPFPPLLDPLNSRQAVWSREHRVPGFFLEPPSDS